MEPEAGYAVGRQVLTRGRVAIAASSSCYRTLQVDLSGWVACVGTDVSTGLKRCTWRRYPLLPALPLFSAPVSMMKKNASAACAVSKYRSGYHEQH